MNRFASTRSEKRASQPLAGFAQCSVGSIDEDGIRYGFTTQALIASTIAIAPAIVTIQSIVTRMPCGRPCVSRSTGLRERRCGSAGLRGQRRAGSPAAEHGRRLGVVGLEPDPGCRAGEPDPDQVVEPEDVVEPVPEEPEHLGRQQPHTREHVLGEEGEAEVLADQDADQSRHDRDHLKLGAAAAAGRRETAKATSRPTPSARTPAS